MYFYSDKLWLALFQGQRVRLELDSNITINFNFFNGVVMELYPINLVRVKINYGLTLFAESRIKDSAQRPLLT